MEAFMNVLLPRSPVISDYLDSACVLSFPSGVEEALTIGLQKNSKRCLAPEPD